MSSRAAVLIDNGYLAKISKYCFDMAKINYEKLSDAVCASRERLRTYVYDCMPYQSNPPTQVERERFSRHDKFLKALTKQNRFEVRLGKLFLNIQTGHVFQKRVDVLFSVDLVRMSWGRQIDTAVLITGDSDFVPAIQAAKEAGVLVILYYKDCKDAQGHWTARAHDELKAVCDECVPIEQDFIDSVLM